MNEMFEQKWDTRVRQSGFFKNLDPICLLLCELVHWKEGDSYIGHPFVMRVQDELYSRELIPFKLESYYDIKARVEEFEKLCGKERDVFGYICLSYQMKEKKGQYQ